MLINNFTVAMGIHQKPVVVYITLLHTKSAANHLPIQFTASLFPKFTPISENKHVLFSFLGQKYHYGKKMILSSESVPFPKKAKGENRYEEQ